jgi:hypothetical protein
MHRKNFIGSFLVSSLVFDSLMAYFFLPPADGAAFGVLFACAPMLLCPRLLAARSLDGLLAPPNAPPPLDCGLLDGCVAGRAAACELAAGREACVLPVDGRVLGEVAVPALGRDAGVLPLAGLDACMLPVLGRVPPCVAKPRSPEGVFAGCAPPALFIFPAFAFPGEVDGRVWAFLFPWYVDCPFQSLVLFEVLGRCAVFGVFPVDGR